jgi:hypothetical protein
LDRQVQKIGAEGFLKNVSTVLGRKIRLPTPGPHQSAMDLEQSRPRILVLQPQPLKKVGGK